MNDLDKSSLPDSMSSDKPIQYFRRRIPGEPASEVRATRPPLSSSALYPIRIDPQELGIGDRIGAWIILLIGYGYYRVHGFPCHCMWGSHTWPECSYENRACPCSGFELTYAVICRCDCGTVRPVAIGKLVSGYSLSCGHCHHRSYPCTCEVDYAA